MAEFNELIRNFDKIRDYMRDFFIYGFKSRNDFKHKSPRTYDNERRRIESYMGEYMKWDYSKNGKSAFISMDCSKIDSNPLYSAWKSKTFTSNDIMLHFYILDALKMSKELSVDELTDLICEQSGQVFDVQTVRNKCKEYVKKGLLLSEKKGRALFYSISKMNFETLSNIAPQLSEAVKFFQGCALFGEIGSFIMDNDDMTNNIFSFKHNYVAHTLEDEILFKLLLAIRNNQAIVFINYNEKNNCISDFQAIPLKIFISASTGRRYLCVYKLPTKRFFTYRLDHIKSVNATEFCDQASEYKKMLNQNLDKVWGVGFGGAKVRIETICIKLFIDEKTEGYILKRIAREGQDGKLERLEENIFLYTKEVFDSNDMVPWIKTFMGRIIQLDGSNKEVITRFYDDIKKMNQLYELDENEDSNSTIKAGD